MSKSLGNFYSLRDLLQKGYSGSEIRWALLGVHYRTQLNFSIQLLDASRINIQRLKDFAARLRAICAQSKGKADWSSHCHEALSKFKEALRDDLNISVALSVLWEWVRELNVFMDQGDNPADGGIGALETLETFDRVLGIEGLFDEMEEIPPDLIQILKERCEARASKDWKKADALRDAIHARGYIIEDGPTGPRLKKVCSSCS